MAARYLAGAIAVGWALACTNPMATDESDPTDDPVPEPSPEPRGDPIVRLAADHGDETRAVWLHVPRTELTGPRPLFVVIGPQGDGRRMVPLFEDHFDDEALFVFPDGNRVADPAEGDDPPAEGDKGKAGKARVDRIAAWHPIADERSEQDVAFLKSVVAIVSGSHKVDSDRVFIVGHWTGGVLALHAGCVASDVFDGVVAMGAAMSRATRSCRPVGPVPVLLVAGSEDQRVLWTGNEQLYGVIESLERWLEPNECDPDSRVDELLDDVDVGDGVRVKQHDWTCDGAAVRLLELAGAIGGWPGHLSKGAKGGHVAQDIDGGDVAVGFLLDPDS